MVVGENREGQMQKKVKENRNREEGRKYMAGWKIKDE